MRKIPPPVPVSPDKSPIAAPAPRAAQRGGGEVGLSVWEGEECEVNCGLSKAMPRSTLKALVGKA